MVADMRNSSKNRQVVWMFFLAVLVYGIYVSFFTSTVHIEVDEELYLELAKSFHYEHRFVVNGRVVNYSCVLYSLLISLAYYVYSPERILLLIRLIGVVCMCSGIFPIWKLSKKVLGDEKKAFFISGLSMIMPYMFDSAYVMQEVLSYPLFLWSVYFLYCVYEEKKTKDIMLLAVFSVLCFFSKTYLFCIPLVVGLYWVFLLFTANEKEYLTIGLKYAGCYAGLFGLFYLGIAWINGGEGSNHYASQVSQLFPITFLTVISAILGIAVYFALFMLNTGIFPLLSVWTGRRKLKNADRKLADTILWMGLFLIVQTVILIVLTEEGVPTIPHKFLFRYFQVLVPVLLILFQKVEGQLSFLHQRSARAMVGAVLLIDFAYFLVMKGNTRQAIADGHIYLLLENLTKYLFPYADAVIIILIAAAVVIFTFGVKKNEAVWTKYYPKGIIIFLICFWILNVIQLPYYTNFIAGGSKLQKDGISLADYLVDKTKNNEKIYYLESGNENVYLRNIYGYLKQGTIVLKDVETVEAESNQYCITAKENADLMTGWTRIALPTEVLDLYMREDTVK